MATTANQQKRNGKAVGTIQDKQAIKPSATEVTSARVALPLGVVSDEEFLSRHVESRFTTIEQRITFKRLLRGLQHVGATTKAGRPVNRPGDVIRWLMENVDVAGISEPE